MEKHQKTLLTIAIAGASASGKTKMILALLDYLKGKNIQHLDMDGYHLHTREERVLLGEYPDEIKANNFDKLISDLRSLKSGKSILMPIYDHNNGIFGKPILKEPKEIIVVEGLHATLINELANQELIDFSIFINPDEDLRKAWKVKRDVTDRYYSYLVAIHQIRERERFVAEQILPQIHISDSIIQIGQVSNHSLCHKFLITRDFCISENDKYDAFENNFLSCFHVKETRFQNRMYYEIECKHENLNLKTNVVNCSSILNFQENLSVQSKGSYNAVVHSLSVLILLLLYVKQAREDI